MKPSEITFFEYKNGYILAISYTVTCFWVVWFSVKKDWIMECGWQFSSRVVLPSTIMVAQFIFKANYQHCSVKGDSFIVF